MEDYPLKDLQKDMGKNWDYKKFLKEVWEVIK